MVADNTIDKTEGVHMVVICIVEIIRHFSVGNKPHSAFYNISSEDCECSVRNQGLNRSVHALFESNGGITVRFTIHSSRIISNAHSLRFIIGTTTDILRAIITRPRNIEQIHMYIADVDHLDWGFAAGRGPFGVWFRDRNRNVVVLDVGIRTHAKDDHAEHLGGA